MYQSDSEVAVRELRRAVEQCRVTVASPDQSVTVTAGPGNALLDVVLSQRALRHGARDLGKLITAAIRQAAQQATDEVSRRSRELTNGRVDVATSLSCSLPELGDLQLAAIDLPGDAFEGAERVRELAADAARQLAGYAAAREELAQLRVSASSVDDGITVTARADGTIETIGIDDAHLSLGPVRLAKLVLATVQAAAAEATRQATARIQLVAGTRLDVQGIVDTEVRRRER